MLARLAALAVFALPLASALTLDTPTGATNGGIVTISWTATTADPSVFSLELVNTIFHNTFAIANNIQTSAGSLTLELPQIPVGDGYTIEAIQNNNINIILATTGDFSVGAQTTSTASSTSTGTGTATAATSLAASTPITPATTSSSSAAPTPTNINTGAAASFKYGVGPVAAVLLSAVAGAAVMF